MPKIKHIIAAHKAKINPQVPGAVDFMGAFDNIIQPMFPYPMMSLSIVVTIEGITKPTAFEIRVNSPTDQLITKGEFVPMVDPFGVGKKIIDLEKVLIKDRGEYTVDIFEKDGEKLKFMATNRLFIAEYPPKRNLPEELIAEILQKDDVVKKVKTEFRPFDNPEKLVKVQISLDPEEKVEEGYISFPEGGKLELDGKEYDLSGIKRQIEWMYGKPIPKNNQEDIENNEGTILPN